ncbi:MAG: metallophosphoesterase [Chloroflexi bacterium]|nr:metallophosphoesterase [Chloroflexota bacterium]
MTVDTHPEKQKLSRRGFLKLATVAAAEAAVMVCGGLTYASIIEPGWVDIAPISLTLPRLSPEFEGYRIAQISDIHIGPWMTRQRLEKIVAQINQQNPDLVVITGDFVYRNPESFADDLISTLSALTPRDAALAVLGNHDHWTNACLVRQILRESGLIELSNAVHTLQRGDALLHIAGVDDHWERKDRLALVLDILPLEGAAILLAHEPDFADISAATGRFDLQLSGHSHGGQVIIPFLGPPMLPLYARKYPIGLYKVKNMLQYTNRGVGMIPPIVRFNCRPEITVLTLESRHV